MGLYGSCPYEIYGRDRIYSVELTIIQFSACFYLFFVFNLFCRLCFATKPAGWIIPGVAFGLFWLFLIIFCDFNFRFQFTLIRWLILWVFCRLALWLLFFLLNVLLWFFNLCFFRLWFFIAAAKPSCGVIPAISLFSRFFSVDLPLFFFELFSFFL